MAVCELVCSSAAIVTVGTIAAIVAIWRRNDGRDRWNSTFLTSLLVFATARCLASSCPSMVPASVLAGCVLPMMQLIARCIHERKPPSTVELFAYLALFALLPAVQPSKLPAIIMQVCILAGCAYPHFGPSQFADDWGRQLATSAGLFQCVPIAALIFLSPQGQLYAMLAATMGTIFEPTLFKGAPKPGANGATSPVKRGKREQLTQDMFRKSKLPQEVDAVVVGSGIGGLAVAALMARIQGKRVLVLEKHYRSGGCTHIFDEYGDLFDSGIHYVGAPNTLGAMMALCGDGSFNLSPMGRYVLRNISSPVLHRSPAIIL